VFSREGADVSNPLRVSPEHVVEHVDEEEAPPRPDLEPSAVLRHNQTDPAVISDGVDRVDVLAESDDRYLLDYWGFYVGYLRTTREGVAELGEALLADRDPVPRWLLDLPGDGDVPWWVPEEYDGRPTFACEHCGEETDAGDVVTPGGRGSPGTDVLCRDCLSAGRE
jgi:hypothetical protein